MSARIPVVQNLQDGLAQLKTEEGLSVAANSVIRYAEMLIRKHEQLEVALSQRLTSDRTDLYQKLIVSLAPSCAESSHRQSYGQSIGRVLELAQHLAFEGTRHTEDEVRNRIEAKLNI